MLNVSLKDSEFSSFQQMIFRIAGISMTPAKKALVAGRLAKRLKHHGLDSYEDYFQLLSRQQDEMQVAVDLLTTNETYFFREPKHFDFLRDRVLPGHPAAAARSGSGARPVPAARSPTPWPCCWRIGWATHPGRCSVPTSAPRCWTRREEGFTRWSARAASRRAMLRTHCLKGVGSQDGQLLIDPALRRRVQLAQINLNEPLPEVGEFDVIFLRNVMIYFQAETKRQVVARLLAKLRPGGIFIVGHSESLNGLVQGLENPAPSIYRKP